MNNRTALLTALCLSWHLTPATRADEQTAPAPVQQAVAELAERFGVPGIAVAAIDDGQVLWLETQGKATEAQTVGVASTFNVASLTKPIFATLVMRLVQDNRFDLDRPLAQHWVDPDVANDPRHKILTARLALSHQSGLPNWRGKKPLAFVFAPGERYEYSGEGFEYVRRAVERATGQSLPELMDRYVTQSAGMNATFFGWSDAFAPALVTGYREDGSALDGAYLKKRGPNAAANTFTTISDMARFAAWVARGAGLPADAYRSMSTVQAAHSNPLETFSVGWRVVTVKGRAMLMHDGREGGLRTLMVVDPTAGDGVVVLTNSSNGELVMRGIVSAVLEDGDAFNRQVDRDVWRFISAQPAPAQAGMLKFIARSPSFSAKFLHAANTVLLNDGKVSRSLATRAGRPLEQVIEAHHEGRIDQEAMATQLMLLDGDPGEAVALVDALDDERARAWVVGLDGLLQ